VTILGDEVIMRTKGNFQAYRHKNTMMLYPNITISYPHVPEHKWNAAFSYARDLRYYKFESIGTFIDLDAKYIWAKLVNAQNLNTTTL